MTPRFRYQFKQISVEQTGRGWGITELDMIRLFIIRARTAALCSVTITLPGVVTEHCKEL